MTRILLVCHNRDDAGEDYIVAARIEDVIAENLLPGTRIYDLGFAHASVPPSKCLAIVEVVSAIITLNVTPVIEIPKA